MKWIIWIVLTLGIGGVKAQNDRPVVTRMSWDEASMTALKERKIVFVAVGVNPGDEGVRKLFSDEAVQLFLGRNAVGIGMDMQSEEGKFFEQKLLMHSWPAYAFFMPYGDLLSIVPVADVGKKADVLLNAGREALKKAEIKKRNSRRVTFREEKPEDLLTEAGNSDKLIFVMGTTGNCQACLLMEKNVLNLDQVADFYNRHFINTRMDVSSDPGFQLKYKLQGCPFWLFLNEEGKVVHSGEGQLDEENFIALGQTALKKSEGIIFEKEAPEVLMDKAEKEGKWVVLDLYMPSGSERKQLEKKVLRDPDVAAFFNAHFLSGSYDMLQEEGKKLKKKYAVTLPQLFYFMDARGNWVHEVGMVRSAEELLQEAMRVVNGRGLAVMQERYEKGERESGFVEEYIEMLGRAGRFHEAGRVASVYLSGLGGGALRNQKNWNIYHVYVTDATSALFSYLKEYRKELGKLYGQDSVDRKILEIWKAGAGEFVKVTEGKARFDETGFKEYVKRLRKEKVEDWRSIARAARMDAAENTGDWRTYTELAEERWNEETVPEAELYSWGVKINENCKDKSIRFKAARWFAIAASDIEKKERLTGKVNLTSYKGFFEKLVDELVK